MENLNLTIDFTGVTPATGGIDVLPAGTHSGKILEFAHFDDCNRLYAYLLTNGMRHRESFNLSSPAGVSFLMAFMQSAGAPGSMFGGKKKVPFHKFAGREVYFNYTPPTVDENGRPVSGSYPKYTFYTKDRYDMINNVSNAVEEDKPEAAEGSSSEDYDFLLDD